MSKVVINSRSSGWTRIVGYCRDYGNLFIDDFMFRINSFYKFVLQKDGTMDCWIRTKNCANLPTFICSENHWYKTEMGDKKKLKFDGRFYMYANVKFIPTSGANVRRICVQSSDNFSGINVSVGGNCTVRIK